MVDWIKENANELIIGAIFFFAGVAVTWFYVRRERQTKFLEWELLADESIIFGVARHATLKSNLDVIWDGGPVEVPRIVSLRITNSGKKEILATDYAAPITIHVPGSKILGAVVTAISTPGIYRMPTEKNHNDFSNYIEPPVSLKPELLNSREWIELQLICDGNKGRLKVGARIAGESRPIQRSRPGVSFIKLWSLSMLLSVPTVGFLVVLLIGDIVPESPSGGQVVALLLAILVATLLQVGALVYLQITNLLNVAASGLRTKNPD